MPLGAGQGSRLDEGRFGPPALDGHADLAPVSSSVILRTSLVEVETYSRPAAQNAALRLEAGGQQYRHVLQFQTQARWKAKCMDTSG